MKKFEIAIFITNIIFGITYSDIIHPSESSHKITCADKGEICQPLHRPCCNYRYACRRLGRGAMQSTFKCLKIAQLGSQCNRNNDCISIGFAECNKNNNTCQCMKNFSPTNESTCSAMINGFCFNNQDCKVNNSICVDNYCQCKPKFFKKTDTLCKESVLEKSCKEDSDCSEILHAKCSWDKKCSCRYGNDVINEAVCSPLLGEYCWGNETCAVDYSVCKNNECQCADGYHSVSFKKCIKNNFGKKCWNDDDCAVVLYATCSEDKICTCKTNFLSRDGLSCLQIIGGFCSTDEQCVVKNSICENDVCECASNSTLFNGQCVIQD